MPIKLNFPLANPPQFGSASRILSLGLFALSLSLASCGKKEGGKLGAEQEKDASAEAAAPLELTEKVAAEESSPLPDTVTFNTHIQPVLSEKCYHCHGPDSGTRQPKKAPLRLDIEEFAFENRENGKPVIIKGKPADSYLVELIHSDDPEVVMPPPESHHSMSAREIALIEKWFIF